MRSIQFAKDSIRFGTAQENGISVFMVVAGVLRETFSSTINACCTDRFGNNSARKWRLFHGGRLRFREGFQLVNKCCQYCEDSRFFLLKAYSNKYVVCQRPAKTGGSIINACRLLSLVLKTESQMNTCHAFIELSRYFHGNFWVFVRLHALIMACRVDFSSAQLDTFLPFF